MMKKFSCLLATVAAFSILAAATAMAADLLPSTQYTITVSKVNSNGSMTAVDTTTATTDASTPPKLDFSLTTIPTKDDCNFVYFELKDAANTVVRQGFAPAPPEADINKLGINDLSTIQAKTFKEVATILGAGGQADDPIPIAYMLIILRSSGVTDADIPILANMASICITGTGGFENFLTSESVGVTAAELDALKSCLIYNPDATKKTLRDFSENFYDAVQEAAAADEQAKMQQAGGFMAEIFMDAAVCAGIEPELILAAHNAAGDAEGSDVPMGQLTEQNPNFMNSINQAMTSFHMRIAAAKVATEYTTALNALGATGAQVTNFLAAGETMFTSFSDIEAQYGDYFMDPQGYKDAHPGVTDEQVQAAIDSAYSTVFSDFQTAIASTNEEIATLKAQVATLLEITVEQLPPGFGQSMDFSGAQVNWPIPQTVMVGWLADFLTAGGTFTYTRSVTSLPLFAQEWWGGECAFTDVPSPETCTGMGGRWSSEDATCTTSMNKAFCENNVGGTWEQRHDFTGMTPVAGYNNLMALREDIQIQEMNRYALYQDGAEPTRAQEIAAKLAFTNAMENIIASIGGTVSEGEKEAIVTLLKQPSME